MARFYSVAKISERISETPEGFLVCEGVPVTRAGDLLYSPGETPITSSGSATVITRTMEDIHDPKTIASFEGKPVTINHPDDFVTPENWKELAVGIVQNVRPGAGADADKLLADLLITDAEAIFAVKSKKLREVSCGYEATYVEEAPGKGRQENIIGNHIALVAAGRCGSECAIFDHAPRENKSMSLKDKIMGLFGKALDEAMSEEEKAAAEKAAAEKAAAEKAATEKAAAEKAAAEKAAAEKAQTGDEDGMAKLEARLAAIEEAISKLVAVEKTEVAAGDSEEEEEVEVSLDADTISRAEILAPGLAKSKDLKVKALAVAFTTEDGKAAINTLLGGKAFDAADKDMLFVAASEMLKTVRRGKLQNAQVSLDSLPGMKAGDMTPEKINQLNAARYGQQN